MKKLFLIFSFLLLLTGCNNTELESVEEEKNTKDMKEPLRAFYTVDIDDFRPDRVAHGDVLNILENIHESIYKIDEKGNLKPRLTKKLQVEEKDGYIIYNMELKDAYFHNGEKLTAEDVRYSIFRMVGFSGEDVDKDFLDNSKYWKNMINGDEEKGFQKGRIETTNEGKVTLYLDDHYGRDMTTHLLAELSILPKDYKELSQKEKPVGLGPYKFEKKENDTIYLTAFEDYHGTVPEIKNIELQKISKKEDRNKAFEEGKLDILDSFPAVDKDKDYQPYANDIYSLVFNLENEKIEKEFREALSARINKELIKTQLFGEAGATVDSPFSPFVNPYLKDVEIRKSYNRDHYYKILEEHPEYLELELEIVYPEEDYLSEAIGSFIKEDLKELENLSFKAIPYEEYREKVLINKDYDMAIVRYNNSLDPFRTMNRFTTRTLKNVSNFYSFEYNELMNDPTSLQKQLDMIYEEIPEVFILDPGYNYKLSEDFENLKTYPYPFINFSEIKYK